MPEELRTDSVVIFDGDDTLWETEQLYDRRRSEAADLVRFLGLDSDKFEDLQRALDVENVSRFGLSPERFPTSSVQAYQTLANAAGQPEDIRISDQIFAISARVFDDIAPLALDVENVLRQLRFSCRLGLLTKGDPVIQAKRIEDSGLLSYFSDISIVGEKDASAFSEMLQNLGSPPRRAWSVGNSLRSDILPAIQIGMSAIWIEAHVWAHEQTDTAEELEHHPRLFIEHGLSAVPSVVAGIRGE
jgi:putative hydrolase of the HAD superfamily